MSLIFQAPFPGVRTSIVMPSPAQGNVESIAGTVQVLRAVDGTVYTHKTSKRMRKLFRWTVTMSAAKAAEAKEFCREYAGQVILVTDHNRDKNIGYLTLNPVELSGVAKEHYTVTFEFEEKV